MDRFFRRNLPLRVFFCSCSLGDVEYFSANSPKGNSGWLTVAVSSDNEPDMF
jgi:hypothetical protein